MWYVVSKVCGANLGYARFITRHSQDAAESWLAHNRQDGHDEMVVTREDIALGRCYNPIVDWRAVIDPRGYDRLDSPVRAANVTDYLEAGEPARYDMVVGIRQHVRYATVLMASNDSQAMRDALAGGAPDDWYRFDLLELVLGHSILTRDVAFTTDTRWEMFNPNFSMDAFIKRVRKVMKP